MKILVVDDERILLKAICFHLEQEGWKTVSCGDGEEAIRLARKEDPDIILLDVMLPGVDGLEACRTIRQFSSVPILLLTARATDMDKLMGFDSGADDYVVKPCNILELKARIRALYRRSLLPARKVSAPLSCGGLVLEAERRCVVREGETIELTALELRLAELLMRNPGRVFSREELLDRVWGVEYAGDLRTVDVHIRRLREKLEPDPRHPQYIMTRWGHGYYMKKEE